MAAPSEDLDRDLQIIAEHSSSEAGHTSPVSGPRARVNSDDITGFGGLFRDTRDVYPPQLELSEEEDGARQSQTQTVAGSSTHPPSSDRPNGQARSSSTPAQGAPRTRTAPPTVRLNTDPYLCQRDFDQFWEQRSRSRRGKNSGHRSDTSTYYSATDYPASLATEATEQDNYDVRRERPSTTSPPYFTPGHTPPPASEATTEYNDSEGKSPVSPGPFSNYHLYDARHGENAVARVRQRFQG